MTNKCKGCGVIFQYNDSSELGYIKKEKIESGIYCQKCFKMKYYGKHVNTNNDIDTEKTIYDINLKDTSITYLVDILNISEEPLEYLKNFINKKLYIVITKFDLLPKKIKEGKIVNFFKQNFYDRCEVICVSSKNKYNIDKYYNLLVKDNIKATYVVGLSNVGKSSFINALLESIGKNPEVTVSPIPNTTTDYIDFNINGIRVIDTPGFTLKNVIHNYLDNKIINNLMPKNEIKVKTFQLKSGYSIIVQSFLRIDYVEGHLNSFNFYMNNNLHYKKVKVINNELNTLPSKIYNIKGKQDVVISGLGFVKVNKEGKIKVYSLDKNLISIRNKMI